MRENAPIVVLVAAVLAFLGIRGFSSDGTGPSKGDAKGGQAATSEPSEPERKTAGDEAPATNEETGGPWLPPRDFQNTGPGSAKTKDLCLDVHGWQTRYLIACLPDPQDSSSGYRFDSLIDAIQRAAETQGYVLDRYYYPWSHKGPAKSSSMLAPFDVEVQGPLTEKGSGKAAVRFSAQGKPSKGTGRTDPKQWPGLLLFRDAQHHRLLQVFLVGETATAGTHKQAFTASLNLIGKSHEYSSDHDHTVRILGPHFSGSQVSLERTLRAWADAPHQKACSPKFTIISGSATAVDKGKLEASCPPHRVTFLATAIPDEEVLKATLRYLGVAEASCQSLRLKRRIAVVYESNTTFGSDTMSKLQEDCEKGKPTGHKPAFFPFPLHVSEVRSAYQQTSGPTKNDTLNLPSFGSKLRFPLTSGRPRDTEPSLDPGMTAVTTERILGTMLNTIARERFRYALILASDVKDKLFLASLLRQRCPEVRLVLLGNDLLFTHRDFSASLRGAIVGSTYPLYARNQHWSVPTHDASHRHIIFPGEQEQGYYNATVALLCPSDSAALLEYGPPFSHLAKVEEAALLRPPVWVSIVGQGGPLPLAAVPLKPSDPSAHYVFPRQEGTMGEGAFQPLHPTLWIIPVLGVTLLLIYLFFFYFSVLWGKAGETEEARWEMQQLFWPRKDSPGAGRLRWRQRFYTFICLTSVLVLYAYLTFIWLIPFSCRWMYGEDVVQMPPWHWIVPTVLASLLLLVVVAFVFLGVLRPAGQAWGWRPVLVSLLLLVAVPVIIWVVMSLSGGALVLVSLVLLVVAFGGIWHKWPSIRDGARRWLPRKAHPTTGDQRHGKATGSKPVRRKGEPRGEEGNHPAKDKGSPAQPGGKTNGRLGLVLLRALVSLFLLVVLAIYYFTNGQPAPRPALPGEWLLFFERATSLASGVSPVAPVFLLAMAFCLWGYVQLKRLYLLGPPHQVESPFPRSTIPIEDYFGQVNDCHDQLKGDLTFPERALERTGALVIWVALFFTFSRLAKRFVPSVEGVWTESLILLGLSGLALLIGYGWLHLWKVWKSIRELLETIALLPRNLGEAFKRIPQAVTGLFGPYLSSERPGRKGQLKARQERFGQFARDYSRVQPHLERALDQGANKVTRELTALIQTIHGVPPAKDGPGPADLRAAALACFTLLWRIWSDPALAERFAEPPTPSPAEAAPAGTPPAVQGEKRGQAGPATGGSSAGGEVAADKLVRDWLTRVQDFVALEVTVYLSQFFVHLRNLILFLTVAPFLMLLAVTSYPFQPQGLWLLLAVTLIGVGTATVIWIIIQIERNEVVSHILSTTPNRLNFHWYFLGQLLVYAAPLLGIVIAASSEVSDLVHSLVDPLIQALR
jgi:hypothetical protein